MNKKKSKIVVISFFNNSNIEGLSILIQASRLGTKKINIAMIGADTYCATCKLKSAQVFAVSIKNLEYQAEKKARLKTNLKSIISEKYYELLDIFSKKNSDILLSH